MSLTLDKEVHVWMVDLDTTDQSYARLQSYLSPFEKSRAARFVHIRDRMRFIAARGSLREILAEYESVSAADIQFVCNAYGKPSIHGSTSLRFNMSHSESLAAIAISRGREVGVDVEACRPELATHEVAQRSFSKAELERFLQTHPQEQAEQFFLYWTLKEAYIKALGMGLSYELNDFDVSTCPRSTNALVVDRRQVQAPQLWKLSNIPAPAPFAAALCFSGAPASVVFRMSTKIAPTCARIFPLAAG